MSRNRLAAHALQPTLAFAAGLVFGLGLLVSRLADPAKVLAFLDVAGAWDPTLLLVMGAAVAVGLAAHALVRGRTQTLIGLPLQLPAAGRIDLRLVLGALLFGVGWGLSGLCPGPGFVMLGTGSLQAVLFVAALVAGIALFDHVERVVTHRRTP